MAIRKRHRPTCITKVNKSKKCNCDGPYQARIPHPTKRGGKLEQSFALKRDAERWETQQLASVIDATWHDPRKAEQPFGKVLDDWQATWTDRLSPTTRRRYEGIIRKYLNKQFGAQPVGAIDHAAVQRYIDQLAKDPEIAPGTVRNVYSVLRTACTKGVRMGTMRTNPCEAVELPRARHQEPVFLTADEVRTVAEAIDAQYRVLVYTAAYTGMRAGELGGLQRRDVDLLRGTITVRQAMKDINGHLELGELKTKQSRRTVSLPAFLKELLKEHLSQPSPGGTGPEAFVFTMKGGAPLRHGAVYRYFRRTVAGYTDGRGKKHPGCLPERLHGLRWHDLRHTCASLSIAAGAHPKLISARLGHSTITITLDRYGHLFPSVEEALADALDAAFVAGDTGAESNVVELR